LSGAPIVIIRKYVSDNSNVSPSIAPAKSINGRANIIAKTVKIIDKKNIITTAFFNVACASSLRPSPFLRATTAVSPTLSAKNIDKINIRGCPVSPTAAIDAALIDPTIIVSTDPIKLDKTISATDGSAIRISVPYASFVDGVSPYTLSGFSIYLVEKMLCII